MAQIAQMFTTLGFKVDDEGLKDLETKLSQIRATTAQFAVSLGEVADKLSEVKRKVSALNKVLNKDSKSSTSKGATEYYSKLSNYIDRVDKAHDSLVLKAPTITSSLNKIRASVNRTANAWERYAVAIQEAKKHMGGISPKSGAQGAGNVKTTINNITNNYNGGSRGAGSGGSGTPRPNPSQPQGDGGSTIIPLGGVRDFFRSMTPATMMAGGAVSAGYAVKEVVEAGREVQKMQTVMLMASDGQKDQLEHNLKFVKDSAMEMGISYTEFGSAYAKMLSATKDSDLSLKSKEDMFTNLSQYMVAIGTTADDQKGVFRALTQMFTKGKVQAEEILQMAERGVPAAMEIKKAALQGLKMTEKEFDLAQKKGLLDPSKLLPLMSKALGDLAVKTGAYAQATKSSAAAQERLNTQWKLFAHTIMQSGLDRSLGALFDSIADFIALVTPIVKGLIMATKAILTITSAVVAWYGANPKLGATIVVLLALLVIYLKTNRQVTTSIWGIINSVASLYQRYGKLILRMGALIVIFKAFYDIAENKDGDETWVTWLTLQFQLLYATVDLTIEKIKMLFYTMAYYGNNPTKLMTLGTSGNFDSTIETFRPPKWMGFAGAPLNAIIDAVKDKHGQITRSNVNPTPLVNASPMSNKLVVDILNNGKPVTSNTFDFGNNRFTTQLPP